MQQSPVVDARRAEVLERRFGLFDAARIRECLEGETLKRAVKLLARAARMDPENPYRALREHAIANGSGFYSEAPRGLPAAEEYRRFELYLREKERESERRGRGALLPSRREALARAFFAPGYRARTYRAQTRPGHERGDLAG